MRRRNTTIRTLVTLIPTGFRFTRFSVWGFGFGMSGGGNRSTEYSLNAQPL